MIKIGITGSFGKTSTCEILYQYLLLAGFKVSLYSSNGFFVNGTTILKDFPRSTLDKETLQSMLRSDEESSVEYSIIEMTGEFARSNNQEIDIDFDLTALTYFHPSLHNHYSSLDELILCKKSIIKAGKVSIINESFNDIFKSDKTFSVNECKLIKSDINGLIFEYKENRYNTSLITKHHLVNLLLAIKILETLEIFDKDTFQLLCSNVKIRGRFEKVQIEDKTIIIDTCFTSGTKLALEELDKICPLEKIKVVFTLNHPLIFNDLHNSYRDESKELLMRSKYIYLTIDRYAKDDEEMFLKYFVDSDFKKYSFIASKKQALEKSIHELNDDEVLLIMSKYWNREWRKLLESIIQKTIGG